MKKTRRSADFSLAMPSAASTLGFMGLEAKYLESADRRVTCADAGRRRANLFDIFVAAPVVVIAAIGLAQFFCLIAASEALGQAAKAGAREASLPKATFQSVSAAVERRLGGRSFVRAIDPVRVEVDGRAVYGVVRPQTGEEIVVTVSVASHRATPDLLGYLGLSLFQPTLSRRRAMCVR